MNVLVPSACLVAGGLLATLLTASAPPQDPMKEMMEKARKWTQPGEQHKLLERFVGKWDVELRMYMGENATPPEKCTAEVRWLMDGRWIESDWSGQMMGMPIRGHHLFGYDNFKMSYVMTAVTSFDTAMNHAEGDMTPDGKSLVLYGTLDEYLTGEHDKMVKYAYRFVSADEIKLEIHDLPIGEVNTKVVEFTYKRAK
jgi:hypothetical protein